MKNQLNEINHRYTLNELLQMERDILYKLQFELGSPCPLTFMRRISKAEKYDIPSRTVAKYLIEITLLDESFLKYNPSLIAAASSWLARKMLKMSAWVKFNCHKKNFIIFSNDFK